MTNQRFSLKLVTLDCDRCKVYFLSPFLLFFQSQLKEVDVDDVYNLQDDMQELMDQHYDIQEALSRTYEMPEGFDEEQLEVRTNRTIDETKMSLFLLQAELEALGDMEVEDEPPAWLSEMPSTAPPSTTTNPVTQPMEIK